MSTHYLLTLTETLDRGIGQLLVKFATKVAPDDQVAIETLILGLSAENQKLMAGLKALVVSPVDAVAKTPVPASASDTP